MRSTIVSLNLSSRKEKEGLGLGEEPALSHRDADPARWNGTCASYALCIIICLLFVWCYCVYSAHDCSCLCCSQAISVLLVALNIVYLLVDETALPKGSSVRKVQVNKPVNVNK